MELHLSLSLTFESVIPFWGILFYARWCIPESALLAIPNVSVRFLMPGSDLVLHEAAVNPPPASPPRTTTLNLGHRQLGTVIAGEIAYQPEQRHKRVQGCYSCVGIRSRTKLRSNICVFTDQPNGHRSTVERLTGRRKYRTRLLFDTTSQVLLIKHTCTNKH